MYTELDERTDGLAARVLAAGYGPNESTIAVLSPNRGETVELLFACANIGVLVLILNRRLEREEHVHRVDLAEPDGLVVSERFADKLSWIESGGVNEPKIIPYDAKGTGSFEDLVLERGMGELLSDVTVDTNFHGRSNFVDRRRYLDQRVENWPTQS